MKKITYFFLYFFICFFPNPLLAWNAVGHMVIAYIAYQELNPAAKIKTDYLVSQLNREYPNIKSFMQLAYWPDALRSQQIEMFTHWHYIDNPISFDGTQMQQNIDTDNAVWAIKHLQKVVQNNKANAYDRARFLAFLVHIVGDLHQPLHNVSLFSKSFPLGDRGGNLYTIKYENRKTNLHKLWDKGVGIFAGTFNVEQVASLATEMMAQYPPAYFNERIDILNSEAWTQEGIDYAKKYVYQTAINQPVANNYIENSRQLVMAEIVLAGYRVGNLLNQILR